MNARDWCTSKDPHAMLAWLDQHQPAEPRSLRHFLCACCRLAWVQLRPQVRKLIVAIEDVLDQPGPPRPDGPCHDALLDLHHQRLEEVEEAACSLAVRALGEIRGGAQCAAAVRALCPPATPGEQADLLRDLFPDLSSVAIGDLRPCLEWERGLAVDLARGIHSERAFDRLPILADALEEAGCQERRILDHLRGPHLHARGCWALEEVLGQG